MAALSNFMSCHNLDQAKKDIENATRNHRKLLETHVETYYEDEIILYRRIELMEEFLDIPCTLRGEYWRLIETTKTEVLEEILKQFCKNK
jgi:hypothetical protein